MKNQTLRDAVIWELIRMAMKAREQSYCPYSRFAVGAALLLGDGRIVTGCNIENAAYSPGNCAERTAIFKAVSEGNREFSAIAVVGGPAGKDPSSVCTPCGMCRQVLMEFCHPETFTIICAKDPETYQLYSLEEMLPAGFGPASLTVEMQVEDET